MKTRRGSLAAPQRHLVFPDLGRHTLSRTLAVSQLGPPPSSSPWYSPLDTSPGDLAEGGAAPSQGKAPYLKGTRVGGGRAAGRVSQEERSQPTPADWVAHLRGAVRPPRVSSTQATGLPRAQPRSGDRHRRRPPPGSAASPSPASLQASPQAPAGVLTRSPRSTQSHGVSRPHTLPGLPPWVPRYGPQPPQFRWPAHPWAVPGSGKAGLKLPLGT